MIISKFTPDQNSIKQELKILNNLLNEQRKLKRILLLHLEKISEGILNAIDPQDANSLISCLNSIKKSFENLKGNINQILELKNSLEDILYSNSLETFAFNEYNRKYLELFEKITDDNIFYYSFIGSLLKFMYVVFPENIQNTSSNKIETLTENNNIINSPEKLKFDDTIDKNLENSLLEKILEEQLLYNKDNNFDNNINNNLNNDIDNNINNNINNDINNNINNDIDNNIDNDITNNLDNDIDNNIDNDITNNLDNNINNNIDNDITNNLDNNNLDNIIEKLIIDDNLEPSLIEELEYDNSKTEKKPIKENIKITEKSQKGIDKSAFLEKTLVVSEKEKKAILPYSILELEECFSNNPEKYSSIQDIIDKEYTVYINNYKNTAFTRFKTTFNLAKNKSNLSFIEALNLSNELFFNSSADPIIIASCKNIDELDIYLSCLDENILEDFKCFEIKYIQEK